LSRTINALILVDLQYDFLPGEVERAVVDMQAAGVRIVTADR
jgi:nicotinamidase-related amidase